MPKPKSWVVTGAVVAVGVGTILLLWPVLFSPISADDRYWFIEVPAETDLSFSQTIRLTIQEIPAIWDTGRFTPLGFLARRVMLLASFRFSVATAAPLAATQGIAKLLLFLLGIGCCIAFVKSLRWRAEPGRLVGVGDHKLMFIGVALAPLVAAGAQAHSQFRNGWISYAVLTYGAVSIVFGAGALVAWCTRRLAERRRGAVFIGILSMTVLGIALNTSYELYYVAFPVALAVVLLFPFSPLRRDPNEKRAKAIIGGTLSLVFISFFLGIRQIISTHCATTDCYVGTDPALGRRVLGTFWNNFLTSIPGLSHRRFLADLDEMGQSTRWPDPATIAIIVVGVLTVGGILVVWWRMRGAGEAARADAQAERRLLLMISVVAFCVGVGGALIMSLSVQAQELIVAVGYPYRHTVLTWTACALSLVTLALALSLKPSPVLRWASPLLLVTAIVLASSFGLPRNLVSNQSYVALAGNRAIADIHREIVIGDRSELGDQRRCESLERAEEYINSAWLKGRLEPAADKVFRQLNRLPYCSTWSEGLPMPLPNPDTSWLTSGFRDKGVALRSSIGTRCVIRRFPRSLEPMRT